MILITVISILLAFLIIGSVIKQQYLLAIILVIVSVILAVMNERVDEKIHDLGKYSFQKNGQGRRKKPNSSDDEYEQEFNIHDHDDRIPDQLIE